MTKHTPVTPLPQAIADAERFRRLSVPEFAALSRDERRRLSDADSIVEGYEKAEQERRANAYPKLVRRTIDRAALLRLIVERMPKDIRPLYEEALAAEAASDEALLRELGELDE